MAICPYCSEEIDSLEYKGHETQVGKFNLKEGIHDIYPDDTFRQQFLCTECGEKITDNEIEARDFLSKTSEIPEVK